MDTPEDAKYSKMTANQVAIMALSKEGVTGAETARTLGLTETYVSLQRKRFKDRMSLASPGLVRKAHHVLKDILSGEPRIEAKTAISKAGEVVEYVNKVYPSHAVQAEVALKVYETFEPKQETCHVDTVNLAVILQQAHAALRGTVMLPPVPVDPLPSPPVAPDGSFERFRRDRIAQRRELRKGVVEVDKSVREVDNSGSEGGHETGGSE